MKRGSMEGISSRGTSLKINRKGLKGGQDYQIGCAVGNSAKGIKSFSKFTTKEDSRNLGFSVSPPYGKGFKQDFTFTMNKQANMKCSYGYEDPKTKSRITMGKEGSSSRGVKSVKMRLPNAGKGNAKMNVWTKCKDNKGNVRRSTKGITIVPKTTFSKTDESAFMKKLSSLDKFDKNQGAAQSNNKLFDLAAQVK